MLVPSKALGNVLVLGLGRSGLAVARYLKDLMESPQGSALVSSITIYGGKAPQNAQDLQKEFCGKEDANTGAISLIFDTEDVQGHYDLCVASPGIPIISDFYQSAAAASDEFISEPAFAAWISPERWIGITGTNGKTTTTTLVAHLLNAAGMKARVAGNIGDPCTEVIQQREEGEWLSVELSSMHLQFFDKANLKAGTLLNITPDHIAWHGNLDDYAAAKALLFSAVEPQGALVIDATAQNTRELYKEQRDAQRLAVPLGTSQGITDDMTQRCGSSNAAFVDVQNNNMLTVILKGQRFELIPANELGIKGTHNQINALAAAALCLSVGADVEGIRQGLVSFRPLEHRIEPCGEYKGVSFFNDSKATNPEAVLPALTAFDGKPVIILLGGHDKGTSLDALVATCLEACRMVICFGEAKERFLGAFRDAAAKTGDSCTCQIAEAQHLADAFELATAQAQSGEVVLLSPACSSFDEFTCFEQRGEIFKQMVAEYIQR